MRISHRLFLSPTERLPANIGVQEVWLEIIARLPDFTYDPARSSFGGWLHTMARRKAFQHLRRARGLASDDPTARDLDRYECPRTVSPDAAYERDEQRRQFRRTLAEFRKQTSRTAYRILLLLLRGWSVPEIAERLGLTPGQVRSLSRALQGRFTPGVLPVASLRPHHPVQVLAEGIGLLGVEL